MTLSQTFHWKLVDFHQYNTMEPGLLFDNFVGKSGCSNPSILNCTPFIIQAQKNGFVSKRVIFRKKNIDGVNYEKLWDL